MSSSDIETLERVVGDVSHTGHVVHGLFTILSKYIDKAKMTESLQAGEHQLHQASVILDHKDVRKLLGSNHAMLTNQYAKLQDLRNAHEVDLESLRSRDFFKRIAVSKDISAWVRKSTAYKHEVIRQSDWAKLGLALRDGKLVPIKDTLVSPSEQTLVAPGSRDMDKAVDKEDEDEEDESDVGLCLLVDFVPYDNVSTEEAHEMQDRTPGESGPSAPRKKVHFSKLLKGKGRAESS